MSKQRTIVGIAATKGDLALIETQRRATFLEGGTQASVVWVLKVVNGIGAGGRISSTVDCNGVVDRVTKINSRLVSKRTIDVTTALRAYKASDHRWSGFASPDDAKAFLRPFLVGAKP